MESIKNENRLSCRNKVLNWEIKEFNENDIFIRDTYLFY